MQGMQEMQVQSLGWEGSLEEEIATHSSILAWKIPCREKPGSQQSIGSHRHDWATEQLADYSAAAAAKLFQSCPTLRPIDGSPPGSSVPGILQARILEWVAISFSNWLTIWSSNSTFGHLIKENKNIT